MKQLKTLKEKISPRSVEEERRDLIDKMDQVDRLNAWSFHVLEKISQKKDLYAFLLERILASFEITHAALYLYKGKKLKLKKSLKKAAGRRWKIPAKQSLFFKQRGEKALEHRSAKKIEDFILFPLYDQEWGKESVLQESFPLGILVLSGEETFLTEGGFGKAFYQMVSAILVSQRRRQESLEKLTDTQEEISRTQKTLGQQQKKLHARYHFNQLIGGRAPVMARVFELLKQIHSSESSILMEGENGTGKEQMAQTLHYNSPRANQPIISICCGLLSEQMLESQLFGHQKGSFTGAAEDHVGLLMKAESGTVFLDEIDEMPLAVQAKFLRVLQEGEIRPLGSAKTEKVDFRLISASQRNLPTLIQEGRFREDLFYRINVIQFKIPPLRERKEDIPLLVDHFLKVFAKRYQRPLLKISKRAVEALMQAYWPGNVRQLKNTLEMTVALNEGLKIQAKDLPPEFQEGQNEALLIPFEKAKKVFVKDYLASLLHQTEGQVSKAAKLAGVKRESFYRLMKQNLKH